MRRFSLLESVALGHEMKTNSGVFENLIQYNLRTETLVPQFLSSKRAAICMNDANSLEMFITYTETTYSDSYRTLAGRGTSLVPPFLSSKGVAICMNDANITGNVHKVD